MASANILDADMATVARWLRMGAAWWVDELRTLLPARVARGAARLRFDARPGALTGADGSEADRKRATIVVPEAMVMRRAIERPPLGARDMAAMIAIEADRLFPLPADRLVLAFTVAPPPKGEALAHVTVAALRRADAYRIAQAVRAAGVEAAAIMPDAAPEIDFLPAFREAGLIERGSKGAAGWYALVGLLVLVNIALLIWRDAARLDAMRQLVDAQQPAVAIADRIATRAQAVRSVAAQAIAQRRRHDVLGWLGRVSAAMPPGTWVQSYDWTGEQLRITGIKPRSADLVGALRALPGVESVRLSAADTVLDVPAGQPFDIVVRIEPQR